MKKPFERYVLVGALVIFGLQVDNAQNASHPQFEVASIKRNRDGTVASSGQAPGGKLVIHNNGILNVILNAYSLWPYQIVNVPAWVSDEHYDIEANAADPSTSHSEMMLMLQSLLEERFKLKVHRDVKELPVFALLPARAGIKLRPSTARCTRVEPNTAVRPPGPDEPPLCGNRMSGNREVMRWNAQNIDIGQLIEVLGAFMGRKIIDRTEFQGRFDVNLEFSRDVSSTDTTTPSLLTVLQD